MTSVFYPIRRITTAPATVADFPADYWDCFAATATAGSAQQWGRLSLRGAQASGGLFSLLIWRGVLGFNLDGAQAPGTVAGWRITDQTPQRLVLDADGKLMRGRMVFEIVAGEVTWTTMLHYHHALGRHIWELAAHVHRAWVPGCLRGAHLSLSRSGAPTHS
jgi:hypothetical protein